MQDADFEWSNKKAKDNKRDHGVTFEEARGVFLDAGRAELFDEEHSEEEGRYSAIGFSRQARLLFGPSCHDTAAFVLSAPA